MKWPSYILACILCITMCMPLHAFAAGGDAETLDLSAEGVKIGVGVGDSAALIVEQLYPDADIQYFDDKFTAYTAVAQGKLDAYIYDKLQMELSIKNGQSGVRVIDETVGEDIRIALGISDRSDIPELEAKTNAFIKQANADGTLDDLYNRWSVLNEWDMPDIEEPSEPKYHLTVGTTGDVEPYSFYEGTSLTGYDIELSRRLAAYLDADVEFKVYSWGSLVPALVSGEADILASNLNITPERAEVITYSDPLFVVENGVMVKDTVKHVKGVIGGTSVFSGYSDLLESYNGKKLGVISGTPLETAAIENFPDRELVYYKTYPDLGAALAAGYIDAFLADEPTMKMMRYENPEVDYIPERLTENKYSFAFKKDDAESAALCGELNEFIEKCNADETIQELEDIWYGADEAKKILSVKMEDLIGENGQITVVTTSTDVPWSYIKDGENVGYDIDLILRFCKESGYSLKLMDVDFDGRIPAVQSGKADFSTDMNVTPEREDEVLFSDPVSTGGIVLAVKAEDLKTVTASTAVREESVGEGVYASLDELSGKKVGVKQGTVNDELIFSRVPDLKVEYYNTVSDMINALENGKIEAYIDDSPSVVESMAQNDFLTYMDEHLKDMEYGFIFKKSDGDNPLESQFNEYLEKIKSDGMLDALYDKWFSGDEEHMTMEDYSDLPDVNGKLTFATEGQYAPFNYVKDGQTVGYEIEIVKGFCEEYGYHLDVELMDFDGLIPSVQTGKSDFGGSAITITEERRQSVDFSIGYYESSVVAVVQKSEAGEKGSFFSRINASFEKTFLRENRYQLFWQGILTTLLIAVLSILLGTALGFLVYMLCRNGNPAANVITRFCTWLFQGMPVVVLLMILYYIIFAKAQITGTVVSIIAFTLVFGAGVYAMLKSGVGAIDRGQTEAAYALGYGDLHTFFRIILPQAVPHFLPAYKGEIVALIKATAVVGYIAVQDLTKMGDIVRSRTYEAFFPLIAVAIIYFVLAAVLNFIVSRAEITINPKRRKRADILKGIKISGTDVESSKEGGLT